MLRHVPAASTPRRLALAVAFLSLAAVPLAGQAIPTPASVLGHEVGADFELATYEESMEYFRALDEASDRALDVMKQALEKGEI